MGKSTVLQSLLLLRQSFLQGLLPSTGLALNGELASVGTARDALYRGAQQDVIGIALTQDSEKEWDWGFRYDRAANVLRVNRSRNAKKLTGTLFGDDFHYLQAERLGPRTISDMSDYNVRLHRQLGSRGEYAAHFLLQFGEEPVNGSTRIHADAASGRLWNQVEAWLGEISPGTRLEVSPTAGADLVTLQYSFAATRQIPDPYRATNVGFGLTYVFPIILASLAARPGSLLIVENPEAHIHPRGQSRLADLLARTAASGIQVIIETHSDHILNGIRLAVKNGILPAQDAQVYYFGRTEQPDFAATYTEVKIDRDGRIASWPSGFFDEWEKSLEQLLVPTSS